MALPPADELTEPCDRLLAAPCPAFFDPHVEFSAGSTRAMTHLEVYKLLPFLLLTPGRPACFISASGFDYLSSGQLHHAKYSVDSGRTWDPFTVTTAPTE